MTGLCDLTYDNVEKFELKKNEVIGGGRQEDFKQIQIEICVRNENILPYVELLCFNSVHI